MILSSLLRLARFKIVSRALTNTSVDLAGADSGVSVVEDVDVSTFEAERASTDPGAGFVIIGVGEKLRALQNIILDKNSRVQGGRPLTKLSLSINLSFYTPYL